MIVDRLERACLVAWPAATRLQRYGWEHCATDGRSGRVNSVWPLGWTDEAPLERAVAHAADWCADRGIAPMFKLADGATNPPELTLMLSAAGFSPRSETLVMTRQIDPYPQRPGPVELHDIANAQVWSPLRESAPSLADAEERRRIVERIAVPRVFALKRRQGAPGAVGMGVLTDDLIGIYLMRTAPWARRNGCGREIVRTLLYWGATHEARLAYLQVEEDNEAACALYRNEGFELCYRYRYWVRD